ncbi:MAG: helix-turn-helix domain-containing protein [Candidatus Obscuribacterales bacterium]|nr:helix-turn-helix domain-containing protein [Candidatus Obscuribacterales bacterium]
MRQKKGEGTKIAQAAKELGVTSVTIRRYITEFNIETTADENGIKVLPVQAMEELQEIRKLKEEGLTNPKVLEILEESRSKVSEKPKAKEKEKAEPAAKRVTRKVQETAAAARRKAKEIEVEEEEEAAEEEEAESEEAESPAQQKADSEEESEGEESEEGKDEVPTAIISADGKSKYSLTCQTCQKTFEHMNPRLRDCLDCYRIKRKERRRGGDKHKTVIQNPLAQQVVNKNQQAQLDKQQAYNNDAEPMAATAAVSAPQARPEAKKFSVREQINFAPVGTTPPIYQRSQVRSYRKAIEETRGITSNLKRRLERPDLPEAERRFLEQIYAYQLILHQGWKHLAEYRQGDSGGSKHEG